MDFAGEVYDGPLEGQWVVKDRSRFGIAIPPTTIRFQDSQENFHANVREYRWSRPLHKWVFVW